MLELAKADLIAAVKNAILGRPECHSRRLSRTRPVVSRFLSTMVVQRRVPSSRSSHNEPGTWAAHRPSPCRLLPLLVFLRPALSGSLAVQVQQWQRAPVKRH